MIHPKDLEPYFDFEPGSRIGVAKDHYLLPFGSHAWFLPGEQCEVTKNDVINISDPFKSVFAGTIPNARTRLVQQTGKPMPSAKFTPRGEGRTVTWPSLGNESTIKPEWRGFIEKYGFWPGIEKYEYMSRDAKNQAVLMDEFEKEKKARTSTDLGQDGSLVRSKAAKV